MSKLFEPSSWRLMKMIETAEAKFAADRKAALDDRALAAQAWNKRARRERYEANIARNGTVKGNPM